MTKYYNNFELQGATIESTIQGKLIGAMDVMPTAQQDLLGFIVMFSGTTTNTYTQGRYYLCVENQESYSWVDITPVVTVSVTQNRAVVSDASGGLTSSDVTSTELGYLGGVTSNVQTQINSKQDEITAGTGLTFGSGASQNTLGHSNSIVAQTTGIGSATEVPIIKYDAQGHITETSSATIYPPTTQGVSGQVWVSDGVQAGVWTNQSSLSVGSATTADSATTATSAGSATNDADGNPIKTTYFKVADMYTTTGSGSSAGISASDPIAMKGWVNTSIQNYVDSVLTTIFGGNY